ncbi:MAG TPA: hypothetical protein VGK24_07410 [Candidatus Angelobacter sp.]
MKDENYVMRAQRKLRPATFGLAAMNVEQKLHNWIQVANTLREKLDLPCGLIEEFLDTLVRMLSPEYVEKLMPTTKIRDTFGLRTNPIEVWLRGPSVESYVVELLEFCALLREFEDDRNLNSKVEKLKTDAFWPVFFELAMAVRMKRALGGLGRVYLCDESDAAIGDFGFEIQGVHAACECTILSHDAEEEMQYWVLTQFYNLAEELLKTPPAHACLKLTAQTRLTGQLYFEIIQRGLKQAVSAFRQDSRYHSITDGQVTIEIEPLPPGPSPADYRNDPSDPSKRWEGGITLAFAEGRDEADVIRKHRNGEPLNLREYGRILVNFPRGTEVDVYTKVRQKLKKKASQTKMPDSYLGRIIFVDLPYDLRGIDQENLHTAILNQVRQTTRTLAAVITHREANPHYRHQYSSFISANQLAMKAVPILHKVLENFQVWEGREDRLLGTPYVRSWDAAQQRVRRHEAEYQEKHIRMTGVPDPFTASPFRGKPPL